MLSMLILLSLQRRLSPQPAVVPTLILATMPTKKKTVKDVKKIIAIIEKESQEKLLIKN